MKCPICQKEFKKIDTQHLKKHGLSKEEYFMIYGPNAPFGYSKELKIKKFGENHPNYNKKRSKSECENISKGMKNLWNNGYVPSDKQKSAIGNFSKKSKESGQQFNKGKKFDRDAFHKNKLSKALKQYYLDNPKQPYDKDSGRYKRQLEIINEIAENRKIKSFQKFDKNILLLEEWSIPQHDEILVNDVPRIIVKCKTCNTIIDRALVTYKKHKFSNTICHTCNPPLKGTSNQENELGEFLRTLSDNVKQHAKNILPNNLELDFVINNNIAIEYHGLYWHSSAMDYPKNKHRLKYELCKEQNIRLIQIFEDEWVNKKDIVKSRLTQILNLNTSKIYARNCTIKEIPWKESSNFLNEYHIQGGNVKSPFNYGLFHNNKLVSVMTFGKPRLPMNQKTNPNTFELVRFASNIQVLGGFSKLLKHFIKSKNPSYITSWADLRWVNPSNNVYSKNGFSIKSESKIGFFYTDLSKRYHRYHKFNNNKNFYTIYDAGQLNYILKINS